MADCRVPMLLGRISDGKIMMTDNPKRIWLQPALGEGGKMVTLTVDHDMGYPSATEYIRADVAKDDRAKSCPACKGDPWWMEAPLCHECGGHTNFMWEQGGWWCESCYETNRRLIQEEAQEELLDALKTTLMAVRNLSDIEDDDEWASYKASSPFIRKVTAAIAKAESKGD